MLGFAPFLQLYYLLLTVDDESSDDLLLTVDDESSDDGSEDGPEGTDLTSTNEEPLLSAGTGGGSNADTRKVVFYLKKAPYPTTWATVVANEYNPQAAKDDVFDVVYKVQRVYDSIVTNVKLPLEQRYDRIIMRMTSKCNRENAVQQLTKQYV